MPLIAVVVNAPISVLPRSAITSWLRVALTVVAVLVQVLVEVRYCPVPRSWIWTWTRPTVPEVTEVAPELDVTTSHSLVARLGEYLRFSSTAINAYCAPVLRRYLEDQAAALRERGLRVEPLIMQASGGVATIAMSK